MKRKISQEEEHLKEQKLNDLDLSDLPDEIVGEILNYQLNSMAQWIKLRNMKNKQFNIALEDPRIMKLVQWKINVPLITEKTKDSIKVPDYFKKVDKMDITFATPIDRFTKKDPFQISEYASTEDKFDIYDFSLPMEIVFKQLSTIKHLIVRMDHKNINLKTGNLVNDLLDVLKSKSIMESLTILEIYDKYQHTFNLFSERKNLKKIIINVESEGSVTINGIPRRNQLLPSEIIIDCTKVKKKSYTRYGSPFYLNFNLIPYKNTNELKSKNPIEKIIILSNPDTHGMECFFTDITYLKIENCMLECNFDRIETLELTNCFFKKTRMFTQSIIDYIILNDTEILPPTEYYYSFDWFINYCDEQQIGYDIKKVSYHKNALSENSIRLLRRGGVECILLPDKPTLQINETKGKKESIKKTIPTNSIEKSIENIKNMNKKMEEMILSHPNTFELLTKIDSK